MDFLTATTVPMIETQNDQAMRGHREGNTYDGIIAQTWLRVWEY
jgi:hypothetical protein